MKDRLLPRHSQGSILLLSVFVMLAIVSAGITLATLIRLQIVQTRNEDDAIRARYVAESAVERALDLISIHRLQKQSGAATNLSNTLDIITGLTGRLLNGTGSYVFDAGRTMEQVTTVHFQLPEFASKQIDLFDTSQPYTTNPNPVESLAVNWVEGEGCVPGTSQLELTLTQFSLNGAVVDTTPQEIIVPCGSFTPQDGFDCRLESNVPATSNNYILRIKALSCDVSYGEFSAFSADGTPPGSEQLLTSHAVVTAQGTVGRAHVTLQASAPWRAAPSGFTDYVLFSDGDLIR